MEQVVGRVLGGSDLQVSVETTDPGSEDEGHDENQESSSDAVHDGLEVTRVLGTRDKHGGLSDERALGGAGDNGVGLAALAAGGVVADIGNVLLDGERLSGHGGLIDSDKSVAAVGQTLLILVLGAAGLLANETLCAHLSLVVVESIFLVVVGADETAVTGNDRSVATTFEDNLRKDY